MGMYDNLKCEYPLSESEVQDALFQTKDFDCELALYTITKEGRLIHHTTRTEEVPEAERPYYGKPEWKSDFYKLRGSIRWVPTGDADMNYHGDLNFYTSRGEHPDYVWYGYIARFTDGQLQWIKRIEDQD